MKRNITLEKLSHLKLTDGGLSSNDVDSQKKKYGINKLKIHNQLTQLEIFIDSLKDPMIWFLLVIGLLHFFIGDPHEGIIVLLSIMPILLMDFFLNWRTEASLKKLKSHLVSETLVKRDSKFQKIKSVDIVIGDRVVLQQNEYSPVDGIILTSDRLQVDESSLTGESLPILKGPVQLSLDEMSLQDSIQVDERKLIFAGTKIISGEGELLVFEIAGGTEYAKILNLLSESSYQKTPLQFWINKIIKILLFISLLLCLVLGVVSYLKGNTFLDSLLIAATLAIAAIPEEFPVVFSFYLGLGVYRLAKNRALVRKAVSVENIGRVNHILTDKTGTLTLGKLKLAHVISKEKSEEETLITALCASSEQNDDPLDKAIFEYAKDKVVSKKTIVARFPFTEDKRRESARDEFDLFHVKGAPETILNLCNLDEDQKKYWINILISLSKEGHKVIACARKQLLTKSEEEPHDGFDFLGFLAFEDPSRPEVKESLAFCHSANIKVSMITGDYLETAKAVAEEVELSLNELKCFSAEEEPEKFTEDWLKRNPDYFSDFDIIARCRPSQKAIIVNSLKRDNRVIAVTGDGINDVPALKSADVSISMGLRGSQSAKEVSHIVLMDDNFRTIVNAIKEGRRLFWDLKKSFFYLILIHIPFVLSAAIIPLWRTSVVFYPSLVVWLELLIHPTAILGFMSNHFDERRQQSVNLFNVREISQTILISFFFLGFMLLRYYLCYQTSLDEDYARSILFSLLVLWNGGILLILGDLKTKRLWQVLILTLLVSILLIQSTQVSLEFHLKPIALSDWIINIIFLMTLISFLRLKFKILN